MHQESQANDQPRRPYRPDPPPGYPGVEMIYVAPGKSRAQAIAEHELAQQQLAPRQCQPAPRKPNESREAFLKRHSRKCQVCRHLYRDAIEDAFVMWRRPRALAETYRLSGDSLYRHAVAFDLYEKRRRNFRSALENIMERGVETDITGETILGAVRAYACLNDDNRWIEPTSNVVFSTKPAAAVAGSVPALIPAAPPAALPGPGNCSFQHPESGERIEPIATNHVPLATASNRGGQELKIDITP